MHALRPVLKQFGKRGVLFFLERLVAWRLQKIQPQIVGITGSVGKTSTKEAVYTVVSAVKSTYRNKKSYNTEFGLMLSILEQETGYSNPLKWIQILWKSFLDTLNLATPPYETLVLEMGADKPGDIEYLLRRIHPGIGILTNIKPVHLGEGQFSNLESIFVEKSKLVKAIPRDGWAILNCDDPNIIRLEHELQCNIILFGSSPKADLRAQNIRSGREGLQFTLSYDKTSNELHFPQLIGRHQAYVLLPAIAVGFLLKMPLPEILKALRTFRLPPGRMSLIEGLEESCIIDSSYNASPDTMVAALDVLNEMRGGRRIAALGSMNELGNHSKQEHRRIGKLVPQVADILITVGKEALQYAETAQSAGMPKEKIHCFEDSTEAGKFLKKQLRKRDIVLVKGSQNAIRMERLIREIMLHPEQAKNLLVRQDDYWNG